MTKLVCYWSTLVKNIQLFVKSQQYFVKIRSILHLKDLSILYFYSPVGHGSQ